MTKLASHKDDSTMTQWRLLVIDDNEAVRTALEMLLSLHGLQVATAISPFEAIKVLGKTEIDLVVQDMNFTRDTTSGEEGIELFHRIKREWPDLPIILLTAWTHLETAVELVKAGAADYIAKPWDDARLMTTVRNLLQLRAALRETQRIREGRREARIAVAQKYDLRGII